MKSNSGCAFSLGFVLLLSLMANIYLCGCAGFVNLPGVASNSDAAADGSAKNSQRNESLLKFAKMLRVEVSQSDSDVDILSNIMVRMTDCEQLPPPPLSEKSAAGIMAVLPTDDAELFKRQQAFLNETAGMRILAIPRKE